MENTRFKITLSDESKYYDLERYLKDAGYFVELERIPPTDEQMGGRVVALILITSLTIEQLHESLHLWQHSKPHIELIEPEHRRKEKEPTEDKPKQ